MQAVCSRMPGERFCPNDEHVDIVDENGNGQWEGKLAGDLKTVLAVEPHSCGGAADSEFKIGKAV